MAMFKRVKNVPHSIAFPSGSSLWFVLDDVTNEQVRKLFGTGLSTQDKVKYSESIMIQSAMTKNYYTLYKCYGVWRVGASGGVARSGIDLDHDREWLLHIFAK